ncbi:MAG TPA: polysaccharide deacetylase family protein [Nitrospira sp.]|nr:polysaccharide deacetylase family protein [Nitrospira sp.]
MRHPRPGDGGVQGLLNGKHPPFDLAKRLYFTIDCDWVPGSQAGLEALLDCCDRYHMTGTVFFAGRFAEAYPDLVRRCHQRGHQLGTHGWAHGGLEDDEDYRTAGYEQQRDWIRRATQAVEQAAGVRPVIFRAPNLWIGETTLRVLEEEGYLYDSSVPARRFDLGFGRVHYLKYFWAPTAPYRPSETDLGRPGESSITEIPPSACLFPVNLATLRVLGLPVLAKMIAWISHTSRHIVFYCHPSEFVYAKDQQFPRTMSKWNRMGMRPENLSLVEELLQHLFERHFVTAHLMHASLPQLDLNQALVLRAGGF